LSSGLRTGLPAEAIAAAFWSVLEAIAAAFWSAWKRTVFWSAEAIAAAFWSAWKRTG
jgi:hypothetical protein